MLLDISHAQFNYKPFPVGVATNVIPADIYHDLCKNFPDISLFANTANEYGTKKFGLSTAYNPDKYHGFLKENKVWKNFANYINSPVFIKHILDTLTSANIDIGLSNMRLSAPSKKEKILDSIASLAKFRLPRKIEYLRTRFEFSAIPADNGSLLPHTDSPKKIVSLVLTMTEKNEWPTSFGGATDILEPIDDKNNFNWINYQLPFDKVRTISSHGYNPNQCLIFIKTFNSWHSVGPMYNAGVNQYRKTVTINITR